MRWTTKRCWMVLVLMFVLASQSGCQILAPFYLGALMMGYDTRVDPLFTLPEDAKRVAVVTYMNLDTQVEMGRLDQELTEGVARRLFDEFGEKKGAIEVVRADKVARWQDEHPDWISFEPVDIGKALKVDYLIYLEVDRITMYEDGPNRALYRGQAAVEVAVTRIEDGRRAFGKEVVTIEFPRDRPIPVTPEVPPQRFRKEFVRRMAERISWLFIKHDSGDEYAKDPF